MHGYALHNDVGDIGICMIKGKANGFSGNEHGQVHSHDVFKLVIVQLDENHTFDRGKYLFYIFGNPRPPNEL